MIDIRTEQLLPVRDVPAYLESRGLGKRVAQKSVQRWIHRGSDGAKLEAIRIGGMLVTAERRARARLRVPHRGSRRRSRRQRLPWADLLRRVFGIDVLVCPKCAGPRRVLAAIHDPAAIARLLAALGLTAAGADPSECRAPPAAEGDAADEGDAAE